MEKKMGEKILVVKLLAEGVYYNESGFIPYSATNLPHESFTISDRNDTYWLAKMTGYYDQILSIQVTNYAASNVEDLFRQQSPKKAIGQLHFEGVHLPRLKSICTSYRQAGLQTIAAAETSPSKAKASLAKLTFEVSIKKLIFEAGRVSFKKKMQWQREPVTFSIGNSHILPEYQYVRAYIGKQIGSSKISVSATIQTGSDSPQVVTCYSPEIEAINSDFFQVLKFKKVASFRKRIIKATVDEDLLDINGLLRHSNDETINKLGLSGSDIIEEMLRKEGIRNKQHIDHLAHVVQDDDQPLYLTLSPSFGFLFIAVGDEEVHYLWEMLNSNATYIWSFHSSVDAAARFSKVTDIISFIRVNGRSAYLHDFDLDGDVSFTRVYHSKVNSHVRDHFPYWRYKIEEVLC